MIGPLADASSPSFGLVLGLLLGLLYGVASYAGFKLAEWVGDAHYTAAVLGGMLVRMTSFLALIAAAIVFLKVDEFSFVGAFFLTFVVVLIVEIGMLHRLGVRESRDRLGTRPAHPLHSD